MTDRASAEGLRDLLTNRQMPDSATLTVTLGELRAALRDTGSRPDSGIDHALHYDPSCEECAYLARPVMLPRPDSGIDALLDDLLNVREGLVSASEAIERAIALARLSTPRQETSEP